MSIASDARSLTRVVTRAINMRKHLRQWTRFDKERGPVPSGPFSAVVYFADDPVNLYQIQQWFAPMVELNKSHSVAVIARGVDTADLLSRECPLPVFWLPTIADVESWVEDQLLGAVFYVNQNSRNFSMMRFRQPAHIFLSHGESDKDYMASNQLKAYDYTFIAGEAARERIAARLIDYDVDKRTVMIGRPQVDVDYPGPELPHDDRTVVLYAPTWEGDRPSMTYSSVVSHGEAMLEALVATGTYRVIYRPHPRTGISDPSYGVAHKRLVAILEGANRSDPTAQHMVDTETAFGWHLKAADECIADISAVAFDWLATGKPIVLTEPISPDAEIDADGIAGTLATIDASDAADVASLLASTTSATQSAMRAEVVKRYFGDTSSGAAMRRWLGAANRLIALRNTTLGG